MGISQYIKEIGRGKDGARALTRAQAQDLFGQVLDGGVTDLEIGAFCLAMRIKGETAEEMAGFLDATGERLHRVPCTGRAVVLPSYNGARRLPVLTPLLALLLARRGVAVVMHGTSTEDRRVPASHLLEDLGIPAWDGERKVGAGEVVFAPTELLSPGLKRLLDVRRTVGLRNSAHSLVKLMNPTAADAVVIGSYTHPEYAISMAAVYELVGATALLLRGTEGEAVADPRRVPQMDGFVRGRRVPLQEAHRGSLATVPELPKDTDATVTAAYIGEVLAGVRPLPDPIALQVEHILHLVHA